MKQLLGAATLLLGLALTTLLVLRIWGPGLREYYGGRKQAEGKEMFYGVGPLERRRSKRAFAQSESRRKLTRTGKNPLNAGK